jgi:hypothetical protein
VSFDKYRIQVGLRRPPDRPDYFIETCEQMRQAIYEQSRDSALIKNLMIQADIRGLSGEDRYTCIAYHALIQLEHHFQRVLSLTSLMPMPPSFLKEPDGK